MESKKKKKLFKENTLIACSVINYIRWDLFLSDKYTKQNCHTMLLYRCRIA